MEQKISTIMDTTQRRYSLLLINPRRKLRYLWDFKELCEVMGKKTPVPPLSLPTIAAITPAHYDIRILDEEVESIDFNLTRKNMKSIVIFSC